MTDVFISYRRNDRARVADNIARVARTEFGATSVFFDTLSIHPGDPFPDTIRQDIKSSDIVLVVIGPNWLEIAKTENNSRLFDEGDWVAEELRYARSLNKEIIPILIDREEMPAPEDVPEDLHFILKADAVFLPAEKYEVRLQTFLHSLHRPSPWFSARTLFFVALAGGIVLTFLDQTLDLLFTVVLTLRDILSDLDCQNADIEQRSCGRMISLLSFLSESMIGDARPVLKHVFINLYEAILAMGILTVLSRYIRIGRDKNVEAVFFGFACAVTMGFLVSLLPGSAFDPITREPGTLWRSATLTAQILGILYILRARLNVVDREFVSAGIFVFSAFLAARALTNDVSVNFDWLSTIIKTMPIPDVRQASILLYLEQEVFAYAPEQRIDQVVRNFPVCWPGMEPTGAKTCVEMPVVLDYTLRFGFALAVACIFPRLAISPGRVFVFILVSIPVAVLTVNALAWFELAALGRTFLLADPGVPQALLLAMAAYALARWPVTKQPIEQA